MNRSISKFKYIIGRNVRLTLLFILFSGAGYAQSPEAKQLLREIDTMPTADGYNALSYYYQWIDFDSSLLYADKAIEIAEKVPDLRGAAMGYYRRSHCQWAMGSSAQSVESALRAIELGQQTGDKEVIAESYRMLAFNYRDQLENDRAQEYVDKARALAQEVGAWDLVVRCDNLNGIMSHNRNRADTATTFKFFFQALKTYREHKTANVHACGILGNIGDIYLETQQFDKALHYQQQGLSMAHEAHNKAVEGGIMAGIGRNYMFQKKYPEAEKMAKQALRISRELKFKRLIMTTYALLSDTYLSKGDANNAIFYMNSYYMLRDSVMTTRKIVELEQRLDQKRKEQAIELLTEQKKMTHAWITFLVVGTVVLLVALIIIYRLQQSRNQKARLLLDTQRQLNLKLTETDQLKSRFFANISHEFRTPLSLILAPIDRKLKVTHISKEDKKDFTLIRRNAQRLLDLINQLLDLSKLEVKKMKLTLQQGKLENFLKILTSSFDSLAETKEIEFNKTITVHSEEAWYDRDKLEKIITNILFNAFKFTPSNERIELNISTSDRDGLIILLSDTGKGIHEDDLKHVFSPFYQSKNTADDGQPGTGLGLSLVQELVKLHNGTLNLTSTPGKGTTIRITLPIVREQLPDSLILTSTLNEIPDTNLVVEIPETTSEGMSVIEDIQHAHTVLIVEDNPELREFIASNFREHYHVLMAEDGREGLDLAIEQVPDLIVSDVMMPNMDGLTLTEKIKSDERTSHIPVILLTAKADIESRLDGLRMGADDYLAKPFSTEELQVRMINLIEIRRKLAAKYRQQLETPSTPTTLETLLPARPVERSMDEKFLVHLMEVIEKNLGVSSFSVEQLADEMCLSRTQLFRKVKGLLEVSPNELITNVRLQRAAELIRQKADTLTQISYSVGFNEHSYFAKRFRKKYGVTPGEYANTPPTAA